MMKCGLKCGAPSACWGDLFALADIGIFDEFGTIISSTGWSHGHNYFLLPACDGPKLWAFALDFSQCCHQLLNRVAAPLCQGGHINWFGRFLLKVVELRASMLLTPYIRIMPHSKRPQETGLETIILLSSSQSSELQISILEVSEASEELKA